jgi:hypothetical protein
MPRMPVDVRIVGTPPNWLTWVSALASLVAVLFAAGAIVLAIRQAATANKALLRERRADFQLDLLKEIADDLIRQGPHFPNSPMTVRARMLPVELIPLTRAVLQLPSNEIASAQVRGIAAGPTAWGYDQILAALRAELTAELMDAVATVLAER